MINDYINFEKDDYPFWNFLELKENCTYEDVQKKALLLTEDNKEDPFIRFAWKVLSDPFFSNTYKKYRSISALYESGFFIDQYNDNNEISSDINFLTTPVDKIINNLNKIKNNEKPNIVLLSTGGFSPIHKRHIEIMKIAKRKMEKKGFNVIGGYISPSHDNYVSKKNNGKAELNIEKRVFLIEKIIEDSNWLSVDKWESYYNKYSINFTDVIIRLENYLNHHIQMKNNIKVCYVFGADNANFSRAFINDGYSVCVSRNGYNEKFKNIKEEFKNSDRIFFVENIEKEITSSSLIRDGSKHLLDRKIKKLYYEMFNKDIQTTKNDIYAIRNDISQATINTGFNCSLSSIENVVTQFQFLISNMFDNNISINEISLAEQFIKAEEIILQKKLKSLSLDIYINGDINFDISRLFELGSGQFKPKKLINRPNTLPLEEQLKNIDIGDYMLIEDDTASGNTLRRLKELLPKNINIKEKLILSHLNKKETKLEYFDIVDMRDFIFGLKHSGLVVSLPNGTIARVPYVLPYTSPISRAKIPIGKELDFSIKVWEMNKIFYESINKQTLLSDMDDSFIKLMKYIGFTCDHKIIDIINWHINKLKRVQE
jgi:nicotinic acid mononucleotide adenylyltransferase